jgi:hypothetical protein
MQAPIASRGVPQTDRSGVTAKLVCCAVKLAEACDLLITHRIENRLNAV